jgi:ABC-2 type transport system ATP-binding protein
MSDETAAINAVNISKNYGSRRAVVDVSFSVKPGEVFGLIGPNGAGKTTVIRMLVGLIKQSSGSISLFGHDISHDFENAIRPVGAIVENPEMYKYFSGMQNLKHFARMRSDITDEQIKSAVALVGLTDRINENITRYSLGMRQRLGIAQAIMHNPKLLILDEPTNGLDPQGIQELRLMIRRLADTQGMAVLLSSHLLHDVQAVCDSIAIINFGRTVAEGSMASFTQGKATYRLVVSDLNAAVSLSQSNKWNVVKSIEADHAYIVESTQEISDLNEVLVKSGIKVSRIEGVTRSLEDAFLELTNSSNQGGAAK